jgi:hypothetical protein
MGGNRFIPGWCHAIVAIAMRNQGWDEVTQIPLTITFADALLEPGPARFTPGSSASGYLLTACGYRLVSRGFRNSYRES